jgi:hypothetical protein
MTYQFARKVGKNKLVFTPIFPFSAYSLSIYEKFYKKNFKSWAKTLKVGKAIYTNSYFVSVCWDNPNILGKMAILARDFFSQTETPTFH